MHLDQSQGQICEYNLHAEVLELMVLQDLA